MFVFHQQLITKLNNNAVIRIFPSIPDWLGCGDHVNFGSQIDCEALS